MDVHVGLKHTMVQWHNGIMVQWLEAAVDEAPHQEDYSSRDLKPFHDHVGRAALPHLNQNEELTCFFCVGACTGTVRSHTSFDFSWSCKPAPV